MNEYLNRVLIYLKQELPEGYFESIKIDSDKFIITISDGADFNAVYYVLQPLIQANIERVRVRQFDLDFTVKSSWQQRDFRIPK